jgi:hypothetical protein
MWARGRSTNPFAAKEMSAYGYYTDDYGLILFLCDGCVRGASADPRFIWWRYGPLPDPADSIAVARYTRF